MQKVLMVVVAIIGILAAIAVPSLNKFMGKARQSEAKLTLALIYTSEKAFVLEYEAYDSRFGAIGFSPDSKPKYEAGFSSATTAPKYTGVFPTGTSGLTLTIRAYCADGDWIYS